MSLSLLLPTISLAWEVALSLSAMPRSCRTSSTTSFQPVLHRSAGIRMTATSSTPTAHLLRVPLLACTKLHEGGRDMLIYDRSRLCISKLHKLFRT